MLVNCYIRLSPQLQGQHIIHVHLANITTVTIPAYHTLGYCFSHKASIPYIRLLSQSQGSQHIIAQVIVIYQAIAIVTKQPAYHMQAIAIVARPAYHTLGYCHSHKSASIPYIRLLPQLQGQHTIHQAIAIVTKPAYHTLGCCHSHKAACHTLGYHHSYKDNMPYIRLSPQLQGQHAIHQAITIVTSSTFPYIRLSPQLQGQHTIHQAITSHKASIPYIRLLPQLQGQHAIHQAITTVTRTTCHTIDYHNSYKAIIPIHQDIASQKASIPYIKLSPQLQGQHTIHQATNTTATRPIYHMLGYHHSYKDNMPYIGLSPQLQDQHTIHQAITIVKRTTHQTLGYHHSHKASIPYIRLLSPQSQGQYIVCEAAIGFQLTCFLFTCTCIRAPKHF